MGYRAFITVSNDNGYKDYWSLGMGDSFSLAEEIIHNIIIHPDFDSTNAVAALTKGFICSEEYFADKTSLTPDQREEWKAIYADQSWTIHFTQNKDSVDILINGYDASGEHVFMRKLTKGYK